MVELTVNFFPISGRRLRHYFPFLRDSDIARSGLDITYICYLRAV